MARATSIARNNGITKGSLDLQGLATELKRQKDSKKDILTPSEQINFLYEGDERFVLGIEGFEEFGINKLFHDQLSAHYKIPKPYYQRIMTDYPELLETTVNTHLQRTQEKRLVRTLDGNARAFLSAGYRPMDNVDLAFNGVLPAVGDVKDLRFDCQITETHLYMKIITPKVQGEITKGDVVEAGVMVRNSEVGHSSLSIQPFVNRLVCMNGLVMPDYGMRKYHAGRRNFDLTEAQELVLTDRTKMLRDAELWSEVRDLITATTNEASFKSMLKPMQEAAGREIEKKPTEAVEVVAEWYGFDDDKKDSMLDNLIRGGDLSQWGIVNAVTAMAHEEEDYDYATELQQIGGELLNLNKSELKLLLTA